MGQCVNQIVHADAESESGELFGVFGIVSVLPGSGRQCQRGNPENPLFRQIEGRLRGADDRGVGAARQQLPHERRQTVDYMLAVIEQQQYRAIADGAGDAGSEILSGENLQIQARGDQPGQSTRIACRGQIDPHNRIRLPSFATPREFERELSWDAVGKRAVEIYAEVRGAGCESPAPATSPP